MGTQARSSARVCFADFEFDSTTGELRRDGVPIRLQPQPARILGLLIARAGQIVTRRELAEQVWGSQTFVDFEQGLNHAIRQIRSALEEDAEHPRFLETIPKRGYRFIAALTAPAEETFAANAGEVPARIASSRAARAVYGCAAAVCAAAVVLLLVGRERRPQAAEIRRIDSLAVLPLHNLSADPEQEYFSDGMTDELITDLAKFTGLRVISHTSVDRYKGAKRSLRDIAQELSVDAVVEGTVMRSGDQVRITAQLIDVRTDRHLWADSYQREFRDVLALQAEVAQQIAREVGSNLTLAERSRLMKVQSFDPVAYEAFLKGNFYWSQLTCAGFEKALDFYQKAASKDPHFAGAYSGIADSYFNLADWRCVPQDDIFEKAKRAAQKSVEIDPELSEGHESLAELAFYYEWDWERAEKEYMRSVELDPNNGDMHSSYAIYLVSTNREREAFLEMNKAHALDPVSEVNNVTFTYVLYLAHHYDEAIAQAQKTLELYPSSGATYYWLGQCYEMKAMPDQAVEAYLKARVGLPNEAAALRTAYQKDGLPGYWRENMRISREMKRPVDPILEAMLYGHTGEKEKALKSLSAAYQQHVDGLQFLKVEPVYDGVRDDPRFKELVARLKF